MALAAAFAHGEEMSRIVRASDCGRIADRSVREGCVEAFKTRFSFEYPSRLTRREQPKPDSMHVRSVAPSDSAEAIEAIEAKDPAQALLRMEKNVQKIAVATGVSAFISVLGLIATIVMIASF
jgi:cell division protein FtsX